MKPLCRICLLALSITFPVPGLSLGADCLSFEKGGTKYPSSIALSDRDTVIMANACAANAPVDSVWVAQEDSAGVVTERRFTSFFISQWATNRLRPTGVLRMERWSSAPLPSREGRYFKAPDTGWRDNVALGVPAHSQRTLGDFMLSWACPVCKTTANQAANGVSVTVILFSGTERDTLRLDFARQDVGVGVKKPGPVQAPEALPRKRWLLDGKRARGRGFPQG